MTEPEVPFRVTWSDPDRVMVEIDREVLIYDRSLSVDEINQVGTWLANRYGTKWRPIKRTLPWRRALRRARWRVRSWWHD